MVASKYTKDLATSATELRLLWAPEALFIRFVCEDDVLVVPYMGRDNKHQNGDIVEVLFDPARQQREWFEVQVTPLNQILDLSYQVTGDAKWYADGVMSDESIQLQRKVNLGWDCDGLRTSAHIQDDATWVVEMAIPASVLYEADDYNGQLQPGLVLHANFIRYERWGRPIAGKKARGYMVPMQWAPTVYGKPNLSPHLMGELHLVE